jgi:hypothetical protein
MCLICRHYYAALFQPQHQERLVLMVPKAWCNHVSCDNVYIRSVPETSLLQNPRKESQGSDKFGGPGPYEAGVDMPIQLHGTCWQMYSTLPSLHHGSNTAHKPYSDVYHMSHFHVTIKFICNVVVLWWRQVINLYKFQNPTHKYDIARKLLKGDSAMCFRKMSILFSSSYEKSGMFSM